MTSEWAHKIKQQAVLTWCSTYWLRRKLVSTAEQTPHPAFNLRWVTQVIAVLCMWNYMLRVNVAMVSLWMFSNVQFFLIIVDCRRASAVFKGPFSAGSFLLWWFYNAFSFTHRSLTGRTQHSLFLCITDKQYTCCSSGAKKKEYMYCI